MWGWGERAELESLVEGTGLLVDRVDDDRAYRHLGGGDLDADNCVA